MNLPDSIAVANKGNIKYVYDAAGIKLKKITTDGSKLTTTLYLFGNFINDTFQYLPQEETKNADVIMYEKFWKTDQVGNNNMAPLVLIYADLVLTGDPR